MGELTFVASFENPLGVDHVGIFVRSPDNAVPEPSGTVVLFAGVASMIVASRCRRTLTLVVSISFFIAGGNSASAQFTTVYNTTYDGGGGITNIGGNLTVSASTINGNEATGIVGNGGGIQNVDGNLTVIDSTIKVRRRSGRSCR